MEPMDLCWLGAEHRDHSISILTLCEFNIHTGPKLRNHFERHLQVKLVLFGLG